MLTIFKTIYSYFLIDLQFQNDNKGVKFEEKWSEMRPVVLKLLQQESVSHNEWHDLFFAVHQVCLWDESAPQKMKHTLKTDIMEFIINAQKVRTIYHLLEFSFKFMSDRLSCKLFYCLLN